MVLPSPRAVASAAAAAAAGAFVAAVVILDPGSGGSAGPRIAPGWQRVALTAEECSRAGSALAATRAGFEQHLRALPGHLAPAEADAKLIRAWFEEEYAKAQRWVAAGCPDDGIRGLYVPAGAPREAGGLQLFEYPDVGSWMTAGGTAEGGKGAVVILTPWTAR